MISIGIDIGTNTILMVVLDIAADGTHVVVEDHHSIARLGENLDASGYISADAVHRAQAILREYATIVSTYPIARVRAVATSALRVAVNGHLVAQSLASVLGFEIEIISGNEEAALTFMGTISDASEPTLLIDIGGGSTELTVGDTTGVVAARSIEIGAVRLSERLQLAPDIPFEQLHTELVTLFTTASEGLPTATSIVAVAGTPTSLAVLDIGLEYYDRSIIDGYHLLSSSIYRLSKNLYRMPTSQLRSLRGIDPKRSDILPAGSSILAAIVDVFHAYSIRVSVRGLRFGVALS